jgi:hypothetical protein
MPGASSSKRLKGIRSDTRCRRVDAEQRREDSFEVVQARGRIARTPLPQYRRLQLHEIVERKDRGESFEAVS